MLDTRVRAFALGLYFAVLGFSIAASPKRVEILHAPHIITDDTELAFDVRALPDPANRILIVAAVDEVGETVRRSDEDLDQDSPATRRIQWNTLGAGDYQLIAQTFGEDAKALDRDQVHVTVLEWRGP